MREQTAIHLIQKRALRTAQPLHAFEDPDGVAVITPEKRRALLENPLGDPLTEAYSQLFRGAWDLTTVAIDRNTMATIPSGMSVVRVCIKPPYGC